MGARPFVPRSLTTTPSLPVAPGMGRRGLEAASLLLFAAAAFLVLALATAKFDPDDPSLHGADWMGSVGGSLAGVLIQGFGCAAWLAPLGLVWVGLPLLRGRELPAAFGLRLAGDLLVAIIVAALLQVAAPEARVFGAGLPGGNVGLFFGEMMRALFSTLGSFLVGVTGIGLILIGRSSFSFIEWCARVSAWMRVAGERLAALGSRLGMAWAEAWRVRRERADAEAREPRIEAPSGDAAIILQLEDDGGWIPLEETGTPPLAISESLRSARAARLVGFSSLEGAARVESEPPSALRVAQVVHGKATGVTSRRAEAEEVDDEYDGLIAGVTGADEDDFDDGSSEDAEEGHTSETASFADDSAPDAFAAEDDEAPAAAAPVAAAPAARAAAAEPLEEEPRIVDTKPAQQVKRVAPNGVARTTNDFELPSTKILEPPQAGQRAVDRNVLLGHAGRLESTLADYGVVGKVEEIHPGPTVTTYEFAPAAGTKVSKVAGLADDLALGLSRKVRIIAPIPGKSRIGFELPNDERQPVNLRELVEDERFQKLGKKAPLPVVLGRDIVGAPFYADLASMPHVIVAGATGAGKSVGLNVMLSSLLFSRTPAELRLLMIDPKVVELAPFDGIPHLLLPVVTDMKQAATALRWAVDEMERRYQLFADAGTKNIVTYNRWVERVRAGELPPPKVKMVQAFDADGEPCELPLSKCGNDGKQLPDALPYIVCVVDEFADLMMQQGKEVETSVARLAQKARAAGMHVVLATQRPSVDVITGMIKANFPSRVAFRVAQRVDSRTILDEQGAEVLLGRGDMLVKLNGATDTLRVQCPFVSEEEVSALTDHLRAQGAPHYDERILAEAEAEDEDVPEEKGDSRFEEAVRIVAETQRCSTSWLQRKMTVGYNRAAKIVEMMERRGYVGPANGARDREVFLPPP